MAQGKPFERSHRATLLKTATLLFTSWKSPHPDGATVLMTWSTLRSTKRKSALSRDLRNAMAWRFSYRQLMVNESSVSFSRLNLNSTTRCWLRFQVWAAAGNHACSSSCQM